jgi:dipeptidyl aminopeptidase/acylaminoacyl peptidase
MLHGTADDVVPIWHSQKLKAELDKVKATSLLVEVTGEGHDFPLLSSDSKYLRSSCTALAFLETIFKR